ncbi:MAG: hypothetical protein ACKOH7_01540 [Solirubrobacterales bacterium]
MSWLASLPAWLLVAISVAVFVLIALAARMLFERVSRDRPRDNHHAVAASLMPGICAIFGIIAGLTLINQVNNLHRAQEAVSREASAAARLAWAGETLPGGNVRQPLVRFIEADTGPGWEITTGEPVPAPVAESIRVLEGQVRTTATSPEAKTQVGNEALAALDDLMTARRERVIAQSTQMPTLFVIALFLAGLAVVANAAALTVGRPYTWRLIVPVVAVVAVDIALVIAMWLPFSGTIQAGDRPLTDVRQQLQQGFFEIR